MSSPFDALRGAFAFLLLPLSLVPLYFAVPRIRNEVAPDPERAPLVAPDVSPTKAQYERWRPLPPAHEAIPVLAYHGVNDDQDHYRVVPCRRRAWSCRRRARLHSPSLCRRRSSASCCCS